MWIICGELQDGFSNELREADSSLITSTRALTRDVARGRTNCADDASTISAAWDQQRTHVDEVSHGLAAFWALCQDLVYEVTGDSGRYVASGWIGTP